MTHFPIFFFFYPGCPGQLTRTTTNLRTHWTPCKLSRQVRHREGDRRARWGSNPGDRGKETLHLPLGHKPQCFFFFLLFLICCMVVVVLWFCSIYYEQISSFIWIWIFIFFPPLFFRRRLVWVFFCNFLKIYILLKP